MSISAVARSNVTPRFSLAWKTTKRRCIEGSARSSFIGFQRSAPCLVKRGGITPMQVVGTPFSTNTRPTTAGSMLYCATHILWDITNTGGAPGSTSESTMPRPSCGGRPETETYWA